MQAILNEVGLPTPGSSRRRQATDPALASFDRGARLKALLEIVTGLDNALRAFGRRNLPLRSFLARAHARPASCRSTTSRGSPAPRTPGPTRPRSWSRTSRPTPRRSTARGTATGSGLEVTELHEVRTLNKWLARLRDEFALRADVLLPIEVTGDDPPPRFLLHRDGEEHPLLDLRSLVATIRHLGEKGMKITRFKGLGEMDAEQLWETTMDPTKRTLMKVQLDDVAAANDLFTTLMGDDVEPRREFIEKHALEVKNLDV